MTITRLSPLVRLALVVLAAVALVAAFAVARGRGETEALPAFELLGVSQLAGVMGEIHHAADPDTYRRLWGQFGFRDQIRQVDFDEYVVVFYLRAEDACPDDVAGVVLDGERLLVDWRRPPGPCEQPLIPTAFAVAIHRATVPASFVAFLEGFYRDYEDVEYRVELEPYSGSAR